MLVGHIRSVASAGMYLYRKGGSVGISTHKEGLIVESKIKAREIAIGTMIQSQPSPKTRLSMRLANTSHEACVVQVGQKYLVTEFAFQEQVLKCPE